MCISTAVSAVGKEAKTQRARIRGPKRQLPRKEAALAATAALLTLKKRAAALWGDDEA